jgi:hypothetical protein|tara:strand:+ start:434 stop:940 length:507 start_codon:yes stop_codon:yes gene_type:complete
VKEYQLTCHCGEMVPVRAGQAGGEIVCSRCGNRLAVPKFGELSRLPLVEEPEVGGRPAWNSSKGLVLLGFVGCVLFMAAGAWLRLPTQSPVQAAAIRKQMMQKTNAEIYDAWKNHFSKATVERPQWIVEKQYAQRTYLKQGASWVLLLLSGVGAACGLIGISGLVRSS